MHDAAERLTVLGWTSFALYTIAALLSFRAALGSRIQKSGLECIWNWLGTILAALGLNKLLNLQTSCIQLGRQFAVRENLMAYRQVLESFFFLGFTTGIMLMCLWAVLRRPAVTSLFLRKLPLAAVGLLLICLYIVIRAACFEHVDKMLGFELERIPFFWLLEAGGLALIIVQALRRSPFSVKRD
ncbi:MAG TPA: hypothetical protein VEN79_05045 [Terriglobia bacterium]|nr:hypothetical protein [Terriglobia bacterium]